MLKRQGDNLGVSIKVIMLSQEVQYLGTYGRLIRFSTVGVITSVRN